LVPLWCCFVYRAPNNAESGFLPLENTEGSMIVNRSPLKFIVVTAALAACASDPVAVPDAANVDVMGDMQSPDVAPDMMGQPDAALDVVRMDVTPDTTPMDVSPDAAPDAATDARDASTEIGTDATPDATPAGTMFVAELTGAQEVPAVRSAASGTATFVLSPDRTTLSYRLSHTAVGTIAAQIHNAFAGGTGVVVSALTTDAEQTGMLTLTAAQVANLESGRLYVNIQTTANRGGELRGQILRPGERLFSAQLGGEQQFPPVTTTATGYASVILGADGITARYYVNVRSITPTLAHVHTAPAGLDGTVLFALAGGASGLYEGTQTLTPAQVTSLTEARWYFNIHTAANPTGEIRGQVLEPGAQLFVTRATGLEQLPVVAGTMPSIGSFVLAPNRLSMRYFVRLATTATGLHLHQEIAGRANPSPAVLLTLPATGTDASGTATLTAAQATELEARGLYLNVHTVAHGGGEARGQVLRPGEELFVARITGEQEVPPVMGMTPGAGMAVLSPSATQLFVRVVSTLTPVAAHIHNAPGGVNSSAVAPVPFMMPSATIAETLTVTPTQVGELRAGRLYFNLHTAANPAGAIRGQILRAGETLYTTQLTGTTQIPPVTTTATGAFAGIVSADRTTFTYAGSFTGIMPLNAHVHLGAVGATGPVAFPLTVSGTNLVGTQTFGVPDHLTALEAGMTYVNLHTTAFPGGELRGQLIAR
jgi:hypothetical protein